MERKSLRDGIFEILKKYGEFSPMDIGEDSPIFKNKYKITKFCKHYFESVENQEENYFFYYECNVDTLKEIFFLCEIWEAMHTQSEKVI